MEREWKQSERGQGPLWSPQDRTVTGPLTQSEGWMEKIEGCSEYAEKEWEFISSQQFDACGVPV